MAVDIGTYGAPRADPERAASRPPEARRRRPRQWLAAALVALVVTDAGVLGLHAGARDPGPAAAVRSLLRALAAGDGATAASLVVAPAGASRLTAADVAPSPLGATDVVATSRSGTTATVRVTTGSTTLLLTLRRAGGSLLRPPRWRVTAGLPTLTVDAPAYEPMALVDGRPVALAHGTARVTVFPGTVTVGLPVAPPADAVTTTRQLLGDAAVTVTPGVDLDTQDTLSQTLSFLVIPGGEVPAPVGGGFVHPSHVDIDEVELAADGRTLTFSATLDELIRVQTAYDKPTLRLAGRATYSPGGSLVVTVLTRTPIG